MGRRLHHRPVRDVQPPRAPHRAPPEPRVPPDGTGALIELRPFVAADFADLISWIAGPDELTMWGGPGMRWPLDVTQLAAYGAQSGDRLRIWTVMHGGKPAGHASMSAGVNRWTARLGRVLVAPHARGRGVAQAMVREAQRVAFDDLGVHRLGLGVYAHNDAARHVYERLGFVREGVTREQARIGGVWVDSVEMGILEPEYRALVPKA
ncbi:MAG: GNAT family N-acetyltransferase [Streptosporangiales bacterium]|nr:GNAT family N-acetyltransferase [Streptosporangiales bacterium]